MYKRIKRISVIILIMFSLNGVEINAKTDNYKINDTIGWNIENGVLYVSGSGALPDYTDGEKNETSPPWYSRKDEIYSIVIGEGITSIGNWSFGRLSNVCGVSLPSTLTNIGIQAFFKIGAVECLRLPNKLKKAGQNAFGYSKIKEVILPSVDSNLYIAFANCEELTKAVVPTGVTKLSMGVFLNCKGLREVKLGETLTDIGQECFSGCSSLDKICLPKSLKNIEKKAFYKSGACNLLCMPESVEYIPESCFANSAIKRIYFENSSVSIEQTAFDNCPTQIIGYKNTSAKSFADLNNITFKTAERLGDKNFYITDETDSGKQIIIGGYGSIPNYKYVSSENEISPPWYAEKDEIHSIVIGEGITGVGDRAFKNHSNAYSLNLPSTLVEIGQESFWGCASLNRIFISESVTSIRDKAFDKIEKLRIFAPEDSCAREYACTNGIAYTRAINYYSVEVQSGEILTENTEVKHNSEITEYGVELKAYHGKNDEGSKIINKANAEIDILAKDIYADENLNCYVEITYKDNIGGCFWLVITSANGEKTQYPPISCTATGEYKTAVFKIKNPKRGAYSVKLTSCMNTTDGYYSENSVYINDIVFYNDGTYNLGIDVKSENTGNIFYDSDAEFAIKVDSTELDGETEARVVFNIYKYGNEKSGANGGEVLLYSEEKSVTLYDDGFKIHIPIEKYGLYRLETETFAEVGGKTYYAKDKTEFSKCVRAKSQNDSFGVNTHFDSRGDYKLMIPLIANAGFGTVRQPIRWTQCEREEGNVKLTDIQKGFLAELKKYNLSTLAILLDVSFIYDKYGASLVGDSIMDKYYNFVKEIASEPEMQSVKMFQVDNEPTQTRYLDGRYVKDELILKGGQYAKMIRTASSALADAGRSDAEIGAFGLCMLQYKNRRDFMNSAFEYILENDGASWLDALTVHPYYESNDPEHGLWGTEVENIENYMENDSVAERCDYFRDIINGKEFVTPSDGVSHTYNFGEKQVWHTEFGWATSYGNGGTNIGEEMAQAKNLIRQYAIVKENRFSDKLWLYSFMDKGLRFDDSEDNYGLVKSCDYSTPYAAKYGYLALANFNNLTAEAKSCRYIFNQDYSYVMEYDFDISDEKVYMLWSTNAGGSRPKEGQVLSAITNVLPNDITFYDMLGNVMAYDEVVKDNKINLTDTPIFAVCGEETEMVPAKAVLLDGLIKIESVAQVKKLDNITLCEENITNEDVVYISYYDDNRLVYIQKAENAAKLRNVRVYKGSDYDTVKITVWENDSIRPKGYPFTI